MNTLRENLLNALGGSCNSCNYNKDKRVLKLITPIHRRGKGDTTYWSECLARFNQDPSGFEAICPNCLEIRKLSKTKQNKEISRLPKLAVLYPTGFGQTSKWADLREKEGYTCLFKKDNFVYLYKHWDKPLCSLEELAAWFDSAEATTVLTDSDEAIILEKVD